MLKEQLQKDLNQALKSGEQLKRLVLGAVMTAIKNRELQKRVQLSKTVSDQAELESQSQLEDEEIVEAISGEVKKRKDSVEQFKAGNRQDLAEKEGKELEILMAYLPEQMSEEEIKEEARAAIDQLGAKDQKDMGKVIGFLMGKLKGRADGGTVSRVVKELLASDLTRIP